MAQEDLYKILGVSQSATADEIKKSFKKLARKYHPDMNPGNKEAERRFKDISQAYDVLGDAAKRKKYDQFGPQFENFSSASSGSPFGGGFRRGPFEYTQTGAAGGAENLEDLFGDLFANLGGGGAGRRGRRMARPGSDIEASIELDFVSAALGGEKRISLGQGRTFTVRVPAGAKTGSRLRVPGKGEKGTGPFPPGDLYVNVKVHEHPYFKREGNDILLETPISLLEALKGAKIKVPTLTGMVDVKIPAGTSSGAKLRLKGKGIADPKTARAGDQYIILKLELPPGLGESDIEKMVEILAPYPSAKRAWE